MKKSYRRFLVLSLTIVALLELLAFLVPAKEKELNLVHRSDEVQLYVNNGTLVSTSPGRFSFWVKAVPARGSTYFSEMQSILRSAGKRPDQVGYLQTLQELDCAENRTRLHAVMYYDKRDRIVLANASVMPQGDALDSIKASNSIWTALCGVPAEAKAGERVRMAAAGN